MSFNLWETLGITREAALAFAIGGIVLAAAMALYNMRRRGERPGLGLNERE